MSQGSSKGVPIDVDSTMVQNSDQLVPSQRATKTALDTKQATLTTSNLGALINGSTAATPNDTDLVATVDTSVVKKITWTNVKVFLKTYFDTLYNITHTGDVTGTTALTIDPTAITGKTTVTAVGTDYALISDTSDGGALKKALISDFGGRGGGVGSTLYLYNNFI